MNSMDHPLREGDHGEGEIMEGGMGDSFGAALPKGAISWKVLTIKEIYDFSEIDEEFMEEVEGPAAD